MNLQKIAFLQSKYFLWILFAVPGIYILWQFLTDIISYGQVIHITGIWSVVFLFLALIATPLRRITLGAKWSMWLMRHRRALGVASFGYAAFHTITYLERKWGYGYILEEAQDPGLLTGWIAVIIFLLLAITSNNQSVRLLKKNWQHLHRTVYIATALIFVHWVLTTIDSQTAYATLTVLCAIECLRFIRRKKLS